MKTFETYHDIPLDDRETLLQLVEERGQVKAYAANNSGLIGSGTLSDLGIYHLYLLSGGADITKQLYKGVPYNRIGRIDYTEKIEHSVHMVEHEPSEEKK